MALKETKQAAYLLICPVPTCCETKTRHARRQYVEDCIKKFNKSVPRSLREKKMSDADYEAYQARVREFRDKSERGRRRGQMQSVASELVDWWKHSDPESSDHKVPFGLFQPERSKRRREPAINVGAGPSS